MSGPAHALVCRLSALSPADRERRADLANLLRLAVSGATELPDGYAVSFASRRVTPEQVGEFASIERRCCPFLTLESLPAAPDGDIVLRITGGEGVKSFVAAALSIAKEARSPAGVRAGGRS